MINSVLAKISSETGTVMNTTEQGSVATGSQDEASVLGSAHQPCNMFRVSPCESHFPWGWWNGNLKGPIAQGEKGFEQAHAAGSEVSQNNFGWNECLWRYLVHSAAQAGSVTGAYPELCPVGFWVSPQMATPQPLWASCWTTVTMKKCFIVFRWDFMCFNLCLLPLVLPVGTTEKVWLPLLSSPLSSINTHC